MASDAIQSTLVPIEISTDGGVTYKQIICIEGFTVTNTLPTNDADTQCGRFVGLGIEGSEIVGTGVVSEYPTAGQMDYKTIRTLQQGPTLVKYRVQYPASGSIGDHLYQTQFAYFTITSTPIQVGQVVKFGFTLKSSGAPANLTPGT